MAGTDFPSKIPGLCDNQSIGNETLLATPLESETVTIPAETTGIFGLEDIEEDFSLEEFLIFDNKGRQDSQVLGDSEGISSYTSHGSEVKNDGPSCAVRPSPKLYVCQNCERVFKVLEAFGSEGKPSTCGECCIDLLIKDEIKRSDLSKYKCAMCDKYFPRKYDCTRHEMIHNNVKPYNCDMCRKSFSRKDKLRVHIMFYHRNRPKYVEDDSDKIKPGAIVCHSESSKL